MRIGIISTPFISVPPRNYGGTELIIYDLAEGLLQKGHDVTVFATGDSSTNAAVSYLYPKAKWPPNFPTELNHVSWAIDEIRKNDFDLVHTHSPIALAMMQRSLPDIPVVHTIHHDRVPETSELYKQFPNVYYTAISHNQRRRESSLPNCTMIYHGLDPDRFEYADNAKRHVCFIGRLSKDKGPDIAIDVAQKANVPIYIAGEPHPEDYSFFHQTLLRQLDLPNVIRLGGINLRKKRLLLRGARALLMPIQWEEPFGLIMIEAMLCGCPVVAFPHGSAREIVETGVTGFLVHSPDEMTRIIQDDGPASSFNRKRCRERAISRFGREYMVSNYLELYKLALSEDLTRDLASH